MDEYILRETVLSYACKIRPCKSDYFYIGVAEEMVLDAKKEIAEELEQLPYTDEVRDEHGRWELFGNDDDDGATYYCSKCNFQLSEDLFYRGYDSGKWINNNVFCFCPHCGAKMDL